MPYKKIKIIRKKPEDKQKFHFLMQCICTNKHLILFIYVDVVWNKRCVNRFEDFNEFCIRGLKTLPETKSVGELFNVYFSKYGFWKCGRCGGLISKSRFEVPNASEHFNVRLMMLDQGCVAFEKNVLGTPYSISTA